MKRTVFLLGLLFIFGIGAGLNGTRISLAQQRSDSRVADIVQAGKIRVGLGLGSPALAVKDPATGEVRGPALELARVLADRIGVKLEPIYYPRPGAVLEGLKTNAWDVTFLVADPARASEVDFSPPYMQSEFTYIVLGGSSIRSIADVDRAGTRVAVPRGDASDLRLTKLLKQAELVRAESIPAAVELVRTGKADAYAAPRFVLLVEADRLPGSRVLEDGFATTDMVAMVPKGNAARLAYVSEFIDEAKASGLVKQTIERGGLRGVQVVPVGQRSVQ